MKIHPTPRLPSNISLLRYDVVPPPTHHRQKKLRRLPHIFSKVLELPFYADADVVVEETGDELRFVAGTDDGIGADVRAHAVEIHPGVTKIVVRGAHNAGVDLSEFELDVWRFRLPSSTLPELATAAFRDGELVVTVPKGAEEEEDDDDDEGVARFVLVQ